MIHIESREQFDLLTGGGKAVCVLFTADWCPDCMVIKPVMPEVEREFSDSYEFLSVDRDPFLDLCQELNVFGIPSFIVFKQGKELGRFVSTSRKSREEIEAFLRKTEKL